MDLPVLTLRDIRCEIGGHLLFQATKLTIEEGDRIGLIGKNGAGKTCLLRILSGQSQEFSGELIGRPSLAFSELDMTELMAKSGGEAAIAHFLKLVRSSASLVLLDEPTTYLDKKNFDTVVKKIQRSPSAFCIASHDRLFLEKVATKIWVIEQGEVKEYACSFSEYLQERSYQAKQYQSDVKKYQREKKKIKETIQAMQEKKDQKKGKPKKMSASEYRIAGVKTKINVKQKKLQKGITQQKNKLQALEKPKRIEEDYDISFVSQMSSLPKRQIIIPAHEAKVGDKTLWEVPDITLRSGDKLGIRGRNGSGKTTYLNYLMSALPESYKVGYFQQNQFNFSNEEMTVYAVIAEKAGSRLTESQIRTLLALLDFRREKAFRKIYQLSRGERVKIALLALFVSDLDVLILDEITNFLDMETIVAVEKVLALYPGIFVFVSHDQYFMEHLANMVLDMEQLKPQGTLIPASS